MNTERAIAAVGPVVKAKDDEMSVSFETTFILHSVALIGYQMIGSSIGLSQEQFGSWSALVIHNSSSAECNMESLLWLLPQPSNKPVPSELL